MIAMALAAPQHHTLFIPLPTHLSNNKSQGDQLWEARNASDRINQPRRLSVCRNAPAQQQQQCKYMRWSAEVHFGDLYSLINCLLLYFRKWTRRLYCRRVGEIKVELRRTYSDNNHHNRYNKDNTISIITIDNQHDNNTHIRCTTMTQQ